MDKSEKESRLTKCRKAIMDALSEVRRCKEFSHIENRIEDVKEALDFKLEQLENEK